MCCFVLLRVRALTGGEPVRSIDSLPASFPLCLRPHSRAWLLARMDETQAREAIEKPNSKHARGSHFALALTRSDDPRALSPGPGTSASLVAAIPTSSHPPHRSSRVLKCTKSGPPSSESTVLFQSWWRNPAGELEARRASAPQQAGLAATRSLTAWPDASLS